MNASKAGTDCTTVIEVDGVSIELDHEGYLLDLQQWTPQVAVQLAQQHGTTLAEPHLQVLHALRDYYRQFDHSPAMRPLVKWIGLQLGADKGTSLYLLQLFPGSPAKLAAQYAGLPKPDNCL